MGRSAPNIEPVPSTPNLRHTPSGPRPAEMTRVRKQEKSVKITLARWGTPRNQRGARPALMRQRGHGPASCRNLDRGRARRACHPSPRSGGMPWLEEASHPGQHHALAFSAEIARAQSGREHLAIHARQLALKPHLQISRRHFGSLLLCLEQAYRPALENHVYRYPRLGLSVIINET